MQILLKFMGLDQTVLRGKVISLNGNSNKTEEGSCDLQVCWSLAVRVFRGRVEERNNNNLEESARERVTREVIWAYGFSLASRIKAGRDRNLKGRWSMEDNLRVRDHGTCFADVCQYHWTLGARLLDLTNYSIFFLLCFSFPSPPLPSLPFSSLQETK